MTRERLAELWPVMEGFKNGQTVQTYDHRIKNWSDTLDPLWVSAILYRLKPQPFECWLEINAAGHALRVSKDGPPKTPFNASYRIIHLREVESEAK